MDGRSHCPPCLKVAKVSPPIPVKRKRKRKGKRWRRRKDIWNEAEFRNQILVEKRILFEEGIKEKFSKFPSRVLMFLKVFHRTFYKFSSDLCWKFQDSSFNLKLESWPNFVSEVCRNSTYVFLSQTIQKMLLKFHAEIWRISKKLSNLPGLLLAAYVRKLWLSSQKREDSEGIDSSAVTCLRWVLSSLSDVSLASHC